MRSTKLRARQAVGELLFRADRSTPASGSLSILMYHAVTSGVVEDDFQMSVPASLFRAHMAALRALDVNIVPLDEGVAQLARGTLERAAVAVVFDDGFVGVHDGALDTLQTYDIRATIFLATDWVGRAAFPATPPILGRPLTWPEVTTLVREARCVIGSHSHTHAVLAQLKAPALREELRRSGEIIAERLGYPPREFAYPFGSYGTFDGRTRDALAENGFTVACTTVWGRNWHRHDPLALKRLRVSWCDSAREVAKCIAGCYDWYRVFQRLQAVRPQE